MLNKTSKPFKHKAKLTSTQNIYAKVDNETEEEIIEKNFQGDESKIVSRYLKAAAESYISQNL